MRDKLFNKVFGEYGTHKRKVRAIAIGIPLGLVVSSPIILMLLCTLEQMFKW